MIEHDQKTKVMTKEKKKEQQQKQVVVKTSVKSQAAHNSLSAHCYQDHRQLASKASNLAIVALV